MHVILSHLYRNACRTLHLEMSRKRFTMAAVALFSAFQHSRFEHSSKFLQRLYMHPIHFHRSVPAVPISTCRPCCMCCRCGLPVACPPVNRCTVHIGIFAPTLAWNLCNYKRINIILITRSSLLQWLNHILTSLCLVCVQYHLLACITVFCSAWFIFTASNRLCISNSLWTSLTVYCIWMMPILSVIETLMMRTVRWSQLIPALVLTIAVPVSRLASRSPFPQQV